MRDWAPYYRTTAKKERDTLYVGCFIVGVLMGLSIAVGFLA